MKKLLAVILLFTMVLVCVLLFSQLKNSKPILPIQTAQGPVKYRIELALTPEEQQTGLMFREKLPKKSGMLFIFKPFKIARMWMKNTLIPLDMVFFDRFGTVTKVHHNAHPHDLTVISSDIFVAGVLEINAGEAQKFGITKGSKLDLSKFK